MVKKHTKLLVVVLDGVPWRNWQRLFGNLEGWVANGEAQCWKIRATLPSSSASCYATMHTGVVPAIHGITGNNNVFRVTQADVFSEARKVGLTTGAVTHSFWSEMFNRSPFNSVRDIEYDEAESTSVNHGRFHSMTGAGLNNQMTPADSDLFATLSMLIDRFELDYGILHSCTLDSMGHRFEQDCGAMDEACYHLDAQLAPYISRWRDTGYEVIVTADHGQDSRGHHGGQSNDQQDTALYYFGSAQGPPAETVLKQVQFAPSLLDRLGVLIPKEMLAKSIFD